jgi:protein ImuB
MAPQRRDETSHLVGGVALLRLGAEEIVPDGGRQEGLWERGGAREHHVIAAFARVQGIVGPEGVLQGSLVGGRGPSDRIEVHPFGDAAPSAIRPTDRPWPGQIPPPSPVLIFEPAPEIAVCDMVGQPIRVDGRGEVSAEPAFVEIDGRARPVTAWAGPWPVDERWWERSRHRRRARFQLAADEEVYLVALDRGRFLLEGRYD